MTIRTPLQPPVWTLAGLSVTDFLRRLLSAINVNELSGYSAQLAYYFFLSLFPSLLFLTTLLAYLPIPHRQNILLGILAHALPKQALVLAQETLTELLHQHKSGLLSFGVLFALYTASNAVTAIGAGFNRVYGVNESRAFWHVWGIALALVLGLTGLLLIALILFFFGPMLIELLIDQFGWGLFPIIIEIIRWPVIIFTLALSIALIHYATPNVHQHWRWLTPGSVFTVAGWLATSEIFAFYVNHFGSYNKTYGSIGAVIVLLTWTYLGGFILFVGGTINSIITQHNRDIETNTKTPTEAPSPPEP